MIFSKKTIRKTSIPKIRKIHSGVCGNHKPKTLKTVNFGHKWPNVGHLRIFRHIHYDFLKEDHKGSFHTKNYENS